MREDIELYERMQECWPRLRKNVLITADIGHSETCLGFAWEHGSVRFELSVVIGRRKGLREQTLLYDDTHTIVADRILLSDVVTAGNGYFLPLVSMRKKVRAGHDPKEVSRIALQRVLHRLLKEPDSEIQRLKKAERSGVSIGAVSGGLMSLGKRA